MRRRLFKGKTAEHMSGRLAWFNGDCPRCPDPIVAQVSQVVRRHGAWIHTGCAPGAGDE